MDFGIGGDGFSEESEWQIPLGWSRNTCIWRKNKFELTLLRPAAPGLAAGPLASEVVLLLLPASLGGLPALLPDDPSDDPEKVRGL